MAKLTAKQQRFCDEYIKDFNATQAAIRAGYSENTAKEIGCENLTKPNIASYLAEKQLEASNRNDITVDFVLQGIKDIALQGEHENNRLKAYDLLGKYAGVYEKDNEQKKTEISPVWEVKIKKADDGQK